MRKVLILTLILCLLAACVGEPTPAPDRVATQIAVEIAAKATMAAWTPTATSTPVPTETVAPTVPPTATPVPSNTPIPRPTVTPPPSIEAEEYAVYSALLQQNPVGYNLGSRKLVRGHTMVLDADMFERTLEVHPLPAELADSYRARNAVSYTLDPNLGPDYPLLPQEDYDEIFPPRQVRWDKFRELYPEGGGLVQFSRVGFDIDGDTALAEMGFRCGDLCGAGGLYLLVKEEGSWKVQRVLMEWMS